MLHDTGELTCPRCGEHPDGEFDAVPVDSPDDQIRTEVDCPHCDAPLVLVVELALPEALAVDWIEDRRTSDS